mmetsp:Transcript_5986/g.6970  ORF Transcript_5986/g.6970 Transcript_5986/m.6970 type:complete len:95 (+) Transcript_5986:124-408(+)|eukprot:CAMPEP_0198264064 /NCGR_PEP_ID=MMETSP1447-20131203/14622_1 /TAXON_ID=420782 /ORGANISM="Chaetoceros dichaeta, Strain CCMP1751" /LENGTH=94 /DNA_ID=CAMNT_0043952881 /DNA_START=79 /DNA_END=363 /DNA_ORIENTATION=+
MSRGDQRQRDREKNLKKHGSKNAQREGNPESRNLDDGVALAAKVAKKAATRKEEEDNALKATSQKTVSRKKVSKQVDSNLDDLLSVGLKKTKKK